MEDLLVLDTKIPLIKIPANPDIRRLAKLLEVNAAEAALQSRRGGTFTRDPGTLMARRPRCR